MYGKGESVFSIEPIITSSRKPSYGEFNNTQKLGVQSGVGGLPIVHKLHSCGEGIPIFFFYSQRSGYCPWLNLIKRPLSEARSFWIFLSMELAFWYTSTIDCKKWYLPTKTTEQLWPKHSTLILYTHPKMPWVLLSFCCYWNFQCHKSFQYQRLSKQFMERHPPSIMLPAI